MSAASRDPRRQRSSHIPDERVRGFSSGRAKVYQRYCLGGLCIAADVVRARVRSFDKLDAPHPWRKSARTDMSIPGAHSAPRTVAYFILLSLRDAPHPGQPPNRLTPRLTDQRDACASDHHGKTRRAANDPGQDQSASTWHAISRRSRRTRACFQWRRACDLAGTIKAGGHERFSARGRALRPSPVLRCPLAVRRGLESGLSAARQTS